MNYSVSKMACAFRALVGISTLALSGVAMSTPTLVGSPTNASGIDGVVVDAVTYDVTFSTSSFDSTFSTAGGALDAANALASDLNALKVTGLADSGSECMVPPAPSFLCGIWAGSSIQFSQASYQPSFPSGQPAWQSQIGVFSLGCPQNNDLTGPACMEAAHWTKVATGAPEPATLALLGLGLVGVGLSRRRLAR